jgi:hypothetical protein
MLRKRHYTGQGCDDTGTGRIVEPRGDEHGATISRMVEPFAWDRKEMFCPRVSSFWPSTDAVRYNFVDKKFNRCSGY